MLTKKNAKAYAVLAIVHDLVTDEDLRNLTIEPYLNGRESGFAITTRKFNLKVAFAENRNSDQIVLHAGSIHDFQFAGNVPLDKIYYDKKATRYFREDEYRKVAAEVLLLLGPDLMACRDLKS